MQFTTTIFAINLIYNKLVTSESEISNKSDNCYLQFTTLLLSYTVKNLRKSNNILSYLI